jgi:hypothetical protein
MASDDCTPVIITWLGTMSVMRTFVATPTPVLEKASVYVIG